DLRTQRLDLRGAPNDAWVATEPRELAFGEAARGARHARRGGREIAQTAHVVADLAISRTAERRGVRVKPGGVEPAHLVDQSFTQHRFAARVAAGVAVGTRQGKAEQQCVHVGVGESVARMPGTDWLTGELVNLERANQSRAVVWMQPPRRRRIDRE